MMEKDPKDVAVTDRILVGITWYTVTSVQRDAVLAAQEGRVPHRFRKSQIREVWTA